MYVPYTTLLAIHEDRIRSLLSRQHSRVVATQQQEVETARPIRRLIVALGLTN